MESMMTDDQKICVDCKTSKTPLWRSGPSGPKSLCNACGIRFRKKKSLSISTSSSASSGSDKKKEKQLTLTLPSSSPSSSSSSSSCSTIGDEDNCDLRKKSSIKMVKEVVLLRSGMKKVRIRRNDYKKLGEVEQAAFLLMSLSCGSCVFA